MYCCSLSGVNAESAMSTMNAIYNRSMLTCLILLNRVVLIKYFRSLWLLLVEVLRNTDKHVFLIKRWHSVLSNHTVNTGVRVFTRHSHFVSSLFVSVTRISFCALDIMKSLFYNRHILIPKRPESKISVITAVLV